MKAYLLGLLLILALKTYSQDSCFLMADFDPLSITLNMDSVHALIRKHNADLIGCKAPDIHCIGMKGETISTILLEGNVSVLNFWFTKCKPCVKEFDSLNKLVEDFDNRGVKFISFTWEKKSVVDSFFIQHPFEFATVSDADTVISNFKIAAYPTTIILDKNWKVVQILSGVESEKGEVNNIYQQIKNILETELR